MWALIIARYQRQNVTKCQSFAVDSQRNSPPSTSSPACLSGCSACRVWLTLRKLPYGGTDTQTRSLRAASPVASQERSQCPRPADGNATATATQLWLHLLLLCLRICCLCFHCCYCLPCRHVPFLPPPTSYPQLPSCSPNAITLPSSINNFMFNIEFHLYTRFAICCWFSLALALALPLPLPFIVIFFHVFTCIFLLSISVFICFLMVHKYFATVNTKLIYTKECFQLY